MKPGDLVSFKTSIYSNLGYGLIMRESYYYDNYGNKITNNFFVFTRKGEKLVPNRFMELVQEY